MCLLQIANPAAIEETDDWVD